MMGMKPGHRQTGFDAALRGKLETLLGDRGKDDNRALRWNELAQAIQSQGVSAVLSRIIQRGVGRQLNQLEEQVGQLVTTQTFVAAYSVADLLVAQDVVQSGAVTLANVVISGFNAGAFSIGFTGYADNLHRFNSMGTVQLLIDGVEQARADVGIEVTGGTVRFVIPVALGAVFTGSATSFRVELRAWTRSPDAAGTGYGGFYIRSGKLVVQGGVN